MAEYIDREAISEEIRKYYYKNPPNFSYGEGFDRGLDRAQRAILDAPAADVAPVVHEKWLLDRWPSWPHRECSRCKIMIPRTKEVPDQYWQYCPNCGAKMDGGNEGE